MSLPVVLEPGSSWGTRFSAYRSALAAAQKPGAGVPAYMRWVNRGAARVVAAACAAFGWTPNFVSFVSVCFSTLGLIVLVTLEPAWWTGLIVGTALAVGFMFDSADGQVSRVTGASSKTGEWVDHVADAFRSPAIHFCTAAAVMVYRPESWWLAVVALVYGWVTSGQFMSQILAEQFVRAAGRKQTRGGNLRSFVLLPTDPGVLCWSFVLWGFGVPFMVLYTFLAVIAVAHSSISLRRRFRDLRALAQASSAAGVLSPEVLAKRQAEMLLAHPDAVQNVITAFVDGRKPKAEGLLLDVATLADNPSAVPVRVSVDPSLITESNWCEELIILAEKNPIPLACRMYFTPLAGVAEAAVRVRLARSQAIHALARMKDGQILEARKDVTVAASGCGM